MLRLVPSVISCGGPVLRTPRPRRTEVVERFWILAYVTGLLSTVQVVPVPETVISPLSPSVTPAPPPVALSVVPDMLRPVPRVISCGTPALADPRPRSTDAAPTCCILA